MRRLNSWKFNCWSDDKFRAPGEEVESLEIRLQELMINSEPLVRKLNPREFNCRS